VRYAFRVAYNGARYFGFVRQPGLPTVEGELLKALNGCGLCKEPAKARYQVAARTDRGVSAVCQVIALDVLKKPNVRALNSLLPSDIAILAAAEVPSSFDARRHAISKSYRYVCEAPRGFNLAKARTAAKLMLGQHDFRNFCKHERGRPTIGELEQIKIGGRKILTFDFVAPAFLWQQVRRMVNALLSVGAGKLSPHDLKRMLERHQGQLPGPAPPGGLVLVRVDYRGVKFRSSRRLLAKFANCVLGESNKKPRLAAAEGNKNKKRKKLWIF